MEEETRWNECGKKKKPLGKDGTRRGGGRKETGRRRKEDMKEWGGKKKDGAKVGWEKKVRIERDGARKKELRKNGESDEGKK